MNVWNFWARFYDRLWVQKVSLTPTRDLISSQINSLLNEKEKLDILDAGCGTGQQYGDLVSQFGPESLTYLGIDLSPAMIAEAKKKYPEAAFLVCDVSNFKGNTAYDVIICSHSFPYYQRGSEILAMMADMLVPEGILLLSQACRNTLYDKVVMATVELTTSKAHYRSVSRMVTLGEDLFSSLTVSRISNRAFMPSLYLFRWQL